MSLIKDLLIMKEGIHAEKGGPYSEGYKAYPKVKNPYKIGSSEYQMWKKGWRDAEIDRHEHYDVQSEQGD